MKTLQELFYEAKRVQQPPKTLWEAIAAAGITKDASDLPPRKWSDGKMHEKVGGKWREVPEGENKKPAESQKSVDFNYTHKSLPDGRDRYYVVTNSDNPKYNHFNLVEIAGEFHAERVSINEYGDRVSVYMPEIDSGSLASVKQQLENLVNGKTKPAPQKSTPAKKPTKTKLTPETKIKLSQVKPAHSKQQTTATVSKPLSAGEERIQKMEAEERAYQEALKEKPKIIDGYESYQGIKVIDKKLRKNWDRLFSKATDDELYAIEKWGEPLGGDPYIDIQAFTRDPTHYKDRKLTKNEVTKIVKDLDSAFKKAPPVGTNLIVVTGQGNHSMFFNSLGIKEKNKDKLANEIKKHIGETITNKSYLSTAVNEKGAEEWHDSKIEMRIKVPKDKRAIYLNASNIDSNRYTDDDGENELFINRGAKYRIDKADVGKNRSGYKSVLIELTLIDDGVKK